jgi:hypothetical protein
MLASSANAKVWSEQPHHTASRNALMMLAMKRWASCGVHFPPWTLQQTNDGVEGFTGGFIKNPEPEEHHFLQSRLQRRDRLIAFSAFPFLQGQTILYPPSGKRWSLVGSSYCQTPRSVTYTFSKMWFLVACLYPLRAPS